jgi:hypothetical protein
MSRGKKRALGAVLALFLVGAYIFTLSGYRSQSKARSGGIGVSTEASDDVVAVDARVLSVDPAKNEAIARLVFTPYGALANPDGTPKDDLKFTVNSDTGATERAFVKDKHMAPTDVTLSLGGGQVTDYPFDKQQAELFMFMTGPGNTAVPLDLVLTASVHGFDIVTTPDPDSSADFVGVNFEIKRAQSTLFFAIFVMLAQWMLALGAVTLAWRVATGGVKAELPMMTFLSALLFAFPAIRNALPGTPPIGALNDYIAFFWAEGLVALSLFTIVGTWLLRVARAAPAPTPAEDPEPTVGNGKLLEAEPALATK